MFRLLLAIGIVGTIFVLSPVRPPLTLPATADLRDRAVATALDHAVAAATASPAEPALPPVRLRP